MQSPYGYSERAGRASGVRALCALRLRGPGTFPEAKQSPAPALGSHVKQSRVNKSPCGWHCRGAVPNALAWILAGWLQQQGLGMGSHGRAMNPSGDLVKGDTKELELLLPCVGCLPCEDTRRVPVLQQQPGRVTPGPPLPHHKVCGAQTWKPSSATKIFKEPLSSSKERLINLHEG